MTCELKSWRAPQWMLECPETGDSCQECGSRMRRHSVNVVFCLPCWTYRTKAHLENYHRFVARRKRQFAYWYVERFWLRCGKLRDVRIFHKIMNWCVAVHLEKVKFELMLMEPVRVLEAA